MTPEERQLLTDLFERLRSASAAPRDPQAEAFINDSVRGQPYAPYVLAQTVIVQQHALEAAQQRLQELEAQSRAVAAPQQETSFLGRLFGSGPSAPPPGPAPGRYDSSAYQRGPAGPQGGYAPQQGYAPQGGGYAPQQSGPWGAPSGGGGGGFLSGALQTATGVAGGVLAANALGSLFGGHGGGLFGGGSSAGFGSGFSGPGEVINNYYGGPDAAGQHAEDVLQDQDQDQDDAQDAGDAGGWDDSSSDN